MSQRRSSALAICGLLILLLAACSSDIDQKSDWRDSLNKPFGLDGSPLLRGGSRTAVAGRSGRPPRAMLYPGTDQFVTASGKAIPPGAVRSEEGVLLNFVDADLRLVVDNVLGEVFGLDYYYDQRVQGQVTLHTSSPLSEVDAMSALHLVVQQNGGALVRRDAILAVVPASEASTGTLVPILADSRVSLSPGNAVMIAPMRNASASELASLIEPLAGTQSTVRYDPNRNVLILAGPANDVAALRETISIFDVDWMDGLSYGLLPLKNAQAEDLILELRTVLGGENSPIRDQVVLEPVARMNAVLVVTKRRKLLEDVRNWVGRLDKDLGAGQDGVFVYRVENVQARELADALTAVFGTDGGAGIGTTSAFATSTQTETVSTDGTISDADLSKGSALRIGDQGEVVRVFANESNNTLIVRAAPDTYRRMIAIIKQLDVAPLQVLIEATIAEVSLTNQLNYGVQFFLQNNSRTITSTTNTSSGIAGAFPGLVASYVNGGSEVILSALDSVTQINIISNPRLMVLDNRSARLNVGDEVPIITQQQQSTTDSSNIINQVEFRQTGLVLDVTPRVSSSGLVTLDIVQETSNVVDNASTGSLTPTISQRSLESSIAVQNGQTILLGGLIEANDRRGKTGTPVLSDVPLLGGLFGTRRNSSARTEIIVMLTPRVVRDPREVRNITEELRRRIANLPPSMAPRNNLTKIGSTN